ncbi:MAG: hypothetical protein KF764_24215 [Labilithrix sp.]|nr:hypothetical protein [Labilithrix sp.]
MQRRIDANRVVITQPKVPEARLDIAVEGDRLTLGTRVDVRAATDLAAALEKASRGGAVRWERQPL